MDDKERDQMLRDILAQAKLTNGRVGRLEARAHAVDLELYGDERLGRPGVFERAEAWDHTAAAVEGVVLWLKRGTVALLTAATGLGVNLLLEAI